MKPQKNSQRGGTPSEEDILELAKTFGKWSADAKVTFCTVVLAHLQEKLDRLTEFSINTAKTIGACKILLTRLGATPEMWADAKNEVEGNFMLDIAVREIEGTAAKAEDAQYRRLIKDIVSMGAPKRKRRGLHKKAPRKRGA